MAQETDINPVRVILGEIKQLDLLGLFNSKIRKKKKMMHQMAELKSIISYSKF